MFKERRMVDLPNRGLTPCYLSAAGPDCSGKVEVVYMYLHDGAVDLTHEKVEPERIKSGW